MTAVTINTIFYGVSIGISVCTVGLCVSMWRTLRRASREAKAWKAVQDAKGHR